MLRVSPVLSAVPRLGTHKSEACMGAEPSNSADGKEAEFHELAKAGMSAHARCESVSSSVSLGFCMDLLVKS